MGTHSDEEKQLPSPEVASSFPIQLDPYGIPLHPQPTNDELDPLNWSRWHKWTIIFIVFLSNFLSVYQTSTTVAAFAQLEEVFHVDYSEINWTFAIPSLGLAVGPLIVSSLGDIYGRRPIFIASSIVTMIATGCATIRSLNYSAYMFFRFLQGLSAGPCLPTGFAIIRDISWEHERGFNSGIWVLGVDSGFVLGGVVGGFTAATGPYWANYNVVIGYGVLLCLVVFLLPETLYPRELVLEKIHADQPLDDLKRTQKIMPWVLAKVPGVSHPPIWQNAARFLQLFTFPRITTVVLPFVFLQYWWNVSAMTMEPAAYEDKSVQVQGLLFLGFFVGLLVSEVLCSGQLSDAICARLALRNEGIRTPEMRLYLGYLGAILGAVGLFIWGRSVDASWHWMVGQVGFFLLAAGLQITNTAVTTYIFECYTEYPLEIITFYTVIFNLSAFIEPFFINYWVEAVGYTWSFATQSLTTLILIPIFACIQKWGHKLQKEMIFQ